MFIIELIVPSISFNTMLPVNPSHIIISTLLSNKDLDSILPLKFLKLFSSSLYVLLIYVFPLFSSVPIFNKPILGLFILPKCSM